jgi:hypothetical protein
MFETKLAKELSGDLYEIKVKIRESLAISLWRRRIVGLKQMNYKEKWHHQLSALESEMQIYEGTLLERIWSKLIKIREIRETFMS